jgi:glycopeptide antibiotics resistance protein
MRKNIRAAEWALFALYCLVMFWLLFLHRPSRMTYLPYWDTVKANLNLVPFRTMRLFWDAYGQMPRAALVNLAGNVAVFIPLGLFLPCLFKNQRRFWLFLLTVAGAVVIIETAQLFTTMGSCDVDDLILNLVGAAIGFGIFSLPFIRRGLGRAGLIR